MTTAAEYDRTRQRTSTDIGKDGKCNAKKRQGAGRCARPAGWGTDHPGHGACKMHGGSTQAAVLSASRDMAVVMGAPIDVTPHEGLLHCVRVSAGEVAYCTTKIEELSEDDVLQHPTTSMTRAEVGDEGMKNVDEERKGAIDLHIWIRVRQEAMDRLARFSKMALDAGVDERRVRLAEGMAAAIAPILEAIFKDLQLTPSQRKAAPQLLRSHLLTLEGEAMETNGNEAH